MARSTASIIIIGDEILKGQTRDTNSHFLCRELYKCGVYVSRITVLRDDVDTVAKEVRSNSKLFDYVLTAGGIGPTHDDVTYEGVAKAFDENLILNKELQNIFSRLCLRLDLDESATLKMSHVPVSAEIHHSDHSFIPIVSVQNVFIFPGIPSYLELAFSNLKAIFKKTSKPFYNVCLFVNSNEFNITSCLNATVKEFDSSQVRFGSYPDIENDYYQVKLVLEADSKEALVEAEAFLRSHLPQNSVVGPNPPCSKEALSTLFASKILPLKKSLEILEKCFETYSVENTCLSFNGGKDCTVLLHLTFLFLQKKGLLSGHKKLKVFLVKSGQSFQEIENFIELCVDRYDLEVMTYEHPIKEALSNLKKDHPEIEAILMGSRLTDPHCSQLLPFQKTDDDWPQFMRVNPLSHWSYSEVWEFLKELQVPYCSLYDRGYTSLGCQHNTLPNEELLSVTKSGTSYYMPAYMLKDPQQERKGRSSKKTLTQ
ncbi:FAD synthase [Parasteatoda tepidariorum]|uniref:FAD synthase n=1 Tax=Parasteatoda tepidariorum TaxID=114398 RepID=UPI001C71CB89|nr:FAD synthase [Parasteatoda tepidariorum]XP_015921628.2 FAD synthase [Parasteatoda tepidariorum]XP_015921630.2 FAD synthase [Parasteatoda tepidariorum]XP_015921631.2 FAD synthase [Parasteatoda tepidariorum]